jgi:hypothetical protein
VRGIAPIYAVSHPLEGLGPKDENGSFWIKRDAYPTFYLGIQMLRGRIKYDATQKKSFSARESRIDGTIIIICTGQDEFYYRLDGEDVASEAQLAERLLTRLF